MPQYDNLHLSVASTTESSAVASGGEVLLELLDLIHAVATSAATLDLTATRLAVAEMTSEDRATLSLMSSGAQKGAWISGLSAGVPAVISGHAWIVPVASALGAPTGAFVALRLHGSPAAERAAVRLARFADRFRPRR